MCRRAMDEDAYIHGGFGQANMSFSTKFQNFKKCLKLFLENRLGTDEKF